jgi:hypothetical protein
MPIIDHKPAFDLIQSRLDSREWFFILAPDVTTCKFASMVEGKYYTPGTDTNNHFEVMIVPWPYDGCPLLNIFMMRKAVGGKTLMTRTEMWVVAGIKPNEAAMREMGMGMDPDADIIVCNEAGIRAGEWFDDNFRNVRRRSLDN